MGNKNAHFKDLKVDQHLLKARKKGSRASSENHGVELSGFIAAFADSSKESIVLFNSLYIAFLAYNIPLYTANFLLLTFFIGWFFWKIGRSALLGWSRLERLHKLIKDEQWEIEHHRDQEREELTEMYRQKGLTGSLLTQVIETLMADDNRLLRVMLEEELGLSLESYEHPLKQSIGSGLGVLFACAIGIIGIISGKFYILMGLSAIAICALSAFFSKKEGNDPIKFTCWSVAVSILAVTTIYLISNWTTRVIF